MTTTDRTEKGDRSWWIPNWLERALPRLDVERVALGAVEGRG